MTQNTDIPPTPAYVIMNCVVVRESLNHLFLYFLMLLLFLEQSRTCQLKNAPVACKERMAFYVGVGTQSSLSPSAWEHDRENELIILKEIYEF